jgi:AcrR family transcriptional regulator
MMSSFVDIRAMVRKRSAESTRPTQYASAAILERRKALLKEVLSMIAENGFERFNIRDLSARTSVAKQTIYNIFETRERLLATAISTYFEENDQLIDYRTPAGTLERMIERSIVAGTRAFRIPNYMRALMALYHAPDADPEIWTAIHRVGTYAHETWIHALSNEGLLQPWVDGPSLIDDMARYRYGIIYEWCRGHVASEDLVAREVIGSLSMMRGATRGQGQAAIEEALIDIGHKGLPSYPPVEALDIGVGAGKGDRS